MQSKCPLEFYFHFIFRIQPATLPFVIPAQAGIHRRIEQARWFEEAPLDSRLRGNDDMERNS